ncbi:MAG: hypothetical protein FWF87_09090 [Synergistaceae bacterium]|nr:hypothetical protein [Synergistaceae bacterium]
MEDIFTKANLALTELRDSGKIHDLRRNKGANHYSGIVSDSFKLICELISTGHTITGIFKQLQDKGIFNDSADCSSFFRAVKREQKRRGGRYGEIYATKPREKNTLPVTIQRVSGVSSAPKGVEYELRGKKYVHWQGKELEIPTGYRFLRGKICPEVDDRRLDSKDERQFSFEDYPQHIQDAINESTKNGTVLQDAERNRKLIEEWKACFA